MKKKDLEKMLKQIENIGRDLAEIRVTPESTQIRGNKPAILALLTCLIGNLRYKCDGDFSEEEIRFAIDRGFNDREEFEDDEEDDEDEDKLSKEFDKRADRLQDMLDQLKEIFEKED